MATVGQAALWDNIGETVCATYESTGLMSALSGVVAPVNYARIDVQRSITDDTSTQAVFPTTYDALTVTAGMTYVFHAVYQLTKGANSVSWRTLFGGTATFTTINYIISARVAASGTANNGQLNNATVATAFTATAGGTAVQAIIRLDGEFEINAGGTVIPSVALSGASGATPTVDLGTWFECWPVGANPVTFIGAWS